MEERLTIEELLSTRISASDICSDGIGLSERESLASFVNNLCSELQASPEKYPGLLAEFALMIEELNDDRANK